MIDRTTVSLDSTISRLTIEGSVATSIVGSEMRHRISNELMPTLVAASIWPAGTALNPARNASAK
jgi:hypothetical protein